MNWLYMIDSIYSKKSHHKTGIFLSSGLNGLLIILLFACEKNQTILQTLFRIINFSKSRGLWCAYSMDTGLNGFSADPQKAEEMLRKITKYPDTLTFSELSFMSEEVEKLRSKAYEVDAEEDIIGNQHDFKQGTYEHLLPDPGWIKLRRRADNAMVFIAELGLPYILDMSYFGVYGIYGTIDSFKDKIAEKKDAWLKWCRDKGIKIDLM